MTLSAILAGRAQTSRDYSLATAFNSQWSYNLVASSVTNGLVTNNVGANLYHTLHIINSSTNSIAYSVERTIDTTNWYAGATNTVAASGVAETTITGKEYLLRVRLLSTNSAVKINYLGGR